MEEVRRKEEEGLLKYLLKIPAVELLPPQGR